MRMNDTPRPAEHTHRRAFAHPGFSLLELVIVIALAGVVAALAAPRFASAQARYRADAAARQIAADVALAAERAKAIGGQVTITFAPGRAAYKADYTLAGVSESWRSDLSAEPYMAVITGAAFGAGTTLEFNGRGVPAAAGEITVQSGRVRVVVSVGSTGVATIGTPTQVGARVDVAAARALDDADFLAEADD